MREMAQQPSPGAEYWLGVLSMCWNDSDMVGGRPIYHGCYTDSPHWPDGAKQALNARLNVKLL
jgi:hypothetical protein